MKLPPLHKTISSISHHYDEPGLASAPLSSRHSPERAQIAPRNVPSSRSEDDVRITPRRSNLR